MLIEVKLGDKLSSNDDRFRVTVITITQISRKLK